MLFKKQRYTFSDEFDPFINAMADGTVKNYIRERVIRQLDCYYRQIRSLKNSFQSLSVISLVLSTLIPVFVLLEDLNSFTWKLVIAFISAAITVITGYLSFMKSKELWLQYTQSCETLRSYLYEYLTGADMFKGKTEEEKGDLLISSCEKVLTNEVQSVIQLEKSKGIEAENKTGT